MFIVISKMNKDKLSFAVIYYFIFLFVIQTHKIQTKSWQLFNLYHMQTHTNNINELIFTCFFSSSLFPFSYRITI